MATPVINYPGLVGSQTDFAIPFDYIDPTHVLAFVDGIEVALEFLSTYMVRIAPAPSGSLTVLRQTPTDQSVVEFTDGSVLIDDELNVAIIQALFVVEEAYVSLTNTMVIDIADDTYDGAGRVIKDVADPVNDQDAVTKLWAQTAMASQLATATAAQASATASASTATTKAAEAVVSAATATTKAAEAVVSASTATTKAAEALASAAAAAISEANAAASAAAALVSEDSAAVSAAAALVSQGASASSEAAAAASALAAAAFNPASVAITGGDATGMTLDGLPTAAYQNHGQCRLDLNGGDLKLSRSTGKYLIIDGSVEEVPLASPALSATGLTASTVYFIYAYMSGATMTLEASTTTHAVDVTTGVETKSGDATRTLVGAWYVTTGPVWAPSAVAGLSYFNRKTKTTVRKNTATRSTASTSFIKLSTEWDNSFICWADEDVEVMLITSGYNDTSGYNYQYIQVRDEAGNVLTNSITNSPDLNLYSMTSAREARTFSEGVLHTVSFYNRVSGGTNKYDASTGGEPTSNQLYVSVRG